MHKIILAMALFALPTAVFAQNDSAAVYLQKALDAKSKGHKLIAIQHLEKAASYKKDDRQITGELAVSYLEQRRYAQAKTYFMQLEKLGDQTDSTYRQLMHISFNLRHFDDAIKYASLLKKVRPAEQTAWYLGKSYYEKGDIGNGIKYLDIAAKENPANPEIPYTIARAYADMMNFKSAIPYFHKAIELNPTQARWIYELALIYYAVPDEQNSLKYMIEAGDKGYKKDAEYLQNLAIAYVNAGKSNEAIGMLKDMLANRPTDINILNMLAESLYDAKKYDEAITYWDKMLEIDNKNAEALYMIGLSFQKKGDKQKGQALCDKAIQMDPSLGSLKQKQGGTF